MVAAAAGQNGKGGSSYSTATITKRRHHNNPALNSVSNSRTSPFTTNVVDIEIENGPGSNGGDVVDAAAAAIVGNQDHGDQLLQPPGHQMPSYDMTDVEVLAKMQEESKYLI